MIKDATKVLEGVADESWVPWAGHLIPNIVRRVRAAAEVSSREKRDREVREEAKRLVEEKLAKAAKRDRRLEEKLMAVLEGRMNQAELEIDSEAEEMVEAEGSEAVGTEEFGTTGGTQSSAMEVDEEGEDEVVVVEEAKRGETRKRAPSSPPKSSRKRVRAGTATQTPAGSQVKGSSVQASQTAAGTAVSTANPCWRCVKHKTVCIVPSGGARCDNCRAKHYGCSLVPPKEVVGGKGGPSGSQQAKAVVGSQTKGMSRKARKALTLGKSESIPIRPPLNEHPRTGEVGGSQTGPGCQRRRRAVHVSGRFSAKHRRATCPAGHVRSGDLVYPP